MRACVPCMGVLMLRMTECLSQDCAAQWEPGFHTAYRHGSVYITHGLSLTQIILFTYFNLQHPVRGCASQERPRSAGKGPSFRPQILLTSSETITSSLIARLAVQTTAEWSGCWSCIITVWAKSGLQWALFTDWPLDSISLEPGVTRSQSIHSMTELDSDHVCTWAEVQEHLRMCAVLVIYANKKWWENKVVKKRKVKKIIQITKVLH